jgi:hypothetical protein
MSISRIIACLSLLALLPLLEAQAAPPTAYTVTEAVGGAAGAITTIYRNGSKVLIESKLQGSSTTPASRTLTLYDLQAKTNVSWNPAANPPMCGGAGTFTGDWGDPFAMTADLNDSIAKGEMKAAGTETVNGIDTQVYAGSTPQSSLKAWFDAKDGLVVRAVATMPGGAAMTVVDITKVSLAPPPAALFALPAVCAGVKPPPSPADLIADETGDDPANYVNGSFGPGSTNSCSVELRVVEAKTMTPITKIQVAIDTSYKQESPSHYEFGVRDDGTQTYSGGSVHEITKNVHDGVVSLGIPPAYFMLGVNIIRPGSGGGMGLVYRQCFAPTTVLLYVVKDYLKPSESADFLWVKAGRYAIPPPQ